MITVEDMRFWIMDRTPTDNPLEGDLFFTDEEILRGMKHACREFNAIPPYVLFADPCHMDSSTNIMFEATAEMLYKMKLHSFKRNYFEYTGGNVSFNEDKAKIEGLQELIKIMEPWREQAHALKIKYDTTNYYGTMGF